MKEIENLSSEQVEDLQLLESTVEPTTALEMLAEPQLEQLLGRVTVALEEIRILKEVAHLRVTAARAAGASWAKIAEAAGMAPQSAYQRWSDQGKEKHRDYQHQRRSRSNQTPN
jgi:hypothetical protein